MGGTVTLIARTIPETGTILNLDEVAGTEYAKRRGSAVGGDGLVEFAGRLCYRSWGLPNPATATPQGYMENIIEQAHFSVMEHVSVTMLFTGVSRSFLAEITRHRHLSFSVVSQRFVNADSLNYVMPPAIRDMEGEKGERARQIVADHVEASKAAYRDLVDLVGENDEHGRKQIREASRSVMPNASESPMVISGNIRAWREVLAKRLAPGADKEIREIAVQILDILRDVAPLCVQDISAPGEKDTDPVPSTDRAWRKKPVQIEAVQLLWQNWNDVCDLADVGTLEDGKPTGGYAIPGSFEFANTQHQPTADHVLALAIPTLEGVMIATEGDWIIRGVEGEIYPCRDSIFQATYARA